MIEIKKATFTDEVVGELIHLSHIWHEENITNGLVPNTKEDLKEPCYLAIDNNKIVGYIFGHYYNNEKKVSIECGEIPIGERCFDIDELYVLKEYRHQGIGKKLYLAIEKEAKEQVKFITLGTSTKDYRKILHFYIEEVDMSFHSAFIYKKIN